jgi:hypothetical protein
VILALLADKPPPVDVSAHLDLATAALWALLGLVLLFFAVRPELWRRLWFERVDPRPAGLLRIVFGAVVLWTVVDLIPLARFLFTDEGLWLPKMARRNYSGDFKTLWDPEHGFEHWYDIFLALWYRFSLFHLRADPPFVAAVYAAAIASLALMIVGIKTRVTTVVSWFLVNTIYIYSPIFYSGGDTVVRVFLFLGMLSRWGEAYSLDAWWRRRKQVLAGVPELPPLRPIPAWPLRLMMLQLAIIYCATGALKSGHTWLDGTALFFALNLDHFYRHPAQIQLVTFLQMLWVLPIATWITRIWETAFPVALIGAAVKAFERDRAAGVWPQVAAWRRWLSYACLAGAFGIAAWLAGLTAQYFYDPKLGPWAIDRFQAGWLLGALGLAVPLAALGAYLSLRRWRPRWHAWVLTWLLGKRLWLGVGLVMHLGIDLLMNVGTFVQVMIAVYIAWLTGPELDAVWRTLMSVPQPPGTGDRPLRRPRWRAVLLAPLDRLRYRAPRPPYVVHHAPDDASVRRAALLRLWDLAGRLEFAADPSLAPGTLCVQPPGQPRRLGADAGRALIPVLPGFWWTYPWCLIPGLARACGWLVARTFR